jgi:hypothetical protein
MTKQQAPALSDELQPTFERATEFAESPQLMEAFREAAREPRLWEEASKDPAGFLGGRGVEVPEGLEVMLLDDPMRGRPTPDFEYFSIRLFNCRTYWVKKEGGGYEKVEICWGFEIVPNPVPGGPIG